VEAHADYRSMVRRDVRAAAVATVLAVAATVVVGLWLTEVAGRPWRGASLGLGLAAFVLAIGVWGNGDRHLTERRFVLGPGLLAVPAVALSLPPAFALAFSTMIALLATWAWAISRPPR
jgi:hypothetical protein